MAHRGGLQSEVHSVSFPEIALPCIHVSAYKARIDLNSFSMLYEAWFAECVIGVVLICMSDHTKRPSPSHLDRTIISDFLYQDVVHVVYRKYLPLPKS